MRHLGPVAARQARVDPHELRLLPPSDQGRNPVKRLLAPSLNPAGLSALIAAAVALALGIRNVEAHHQAFTLPVLLSLAWSAFSAYTRTQVTPVADPRDGNGNPLTSARPGIAEQVGDLLSAFGIADKATAHTSATPGTPEAAEALSGPQPEGTTTP